MAGGGGSRSRLKRFRSGLQVFIDDGLTALVRVLYTVPVQQQQKILAELRRSGHFG